jgi:hypothetical protein
MYRFEISQTNIALSNTKNTIFFLVKLKAHQQRKMDVGLTALHGSKGMNVLRVYTYSAVTSICSNRREYKFSLLPSKCTVAILHFEFR